MPAHHPFPPQGLRIGEAAAASGLAPANIRLYEKEGLLTPQGRADNRYRLYSAADVHQLRFIRLCRAMDMSLDEVRALIGLDLRKKTDCAVARQTLDGHLGHVRTRLAELRALERQLVALRGRCDGRGERCRLIEALHEAADRPDAAQAPGRRGRHV